jgi:prepilin-type N-terminal cleavage/methylation domain-containing protein
MTGTFRTTRPRRIRRAVTLAELMVVVLIVSVLAAVAVPQYGQAMNRFYADAAARRIKADLEYLRHYARRTATSRAIVFNLATHSYTLSGPDSLDHPGQAYIVKLSQIPYRASLTTADCGGDATLVFDGFGKPDSSATITVMAGIFQRSVTVEASTGVVALP